jgi:hypothetical protein
MKYLNLDLLGFHLKAFILYKATKILALCDFANDEFNSEELESAISDTFERIGKHLS